MDDKEIYVNDNEPYLNNNVDKINDNKYNVNDNEDYILYYMRVCVVIHDIK